MQYLLLIGAILWLGLYPQPVLRTFRPAMERLRQAAGTAMAAPAETSANLSRR